MTICQVNSIEKKTERARERQIRNEQRKSNLFQLFTSSDIIFAFLYLLCIYDFPRE